MHQCWQHGVHTEATRSLGARPSFSNSSLHTRKTKSFCSSTPKCGQDTNSLQLRDVMGEEKMRTKNARHEDESAFTACFTKVLDSGPCQLQPLPQKTCHSDVTADSMLATRTYWASCLRSLNNRRKQHQTETILHHLQHPDRSRRALCPKRLGPP